MDKTQQDQIKVLIIFCQFKPKINKSQKVA